MIVCTCLLSRLVLLRISFFGLVRLLSIILLVTNRLVRDSVFIIILSFSCFSRFVLLSLGLLCLLSCLI